MIVTFDGQIYIHIVCFYDNFVYNKIVLEISVF